MTAFKRLMGFDPVDLVIHLVVTGCVLGFVGVTDGPAALYPMITAGSVLLLGVRRERGLRRLAREHARDPDRVAEVEERVAYLEGLQDRLVELEERVDFTERLLSRQNTERLPG